MPRTAYAKHTISTDAYRVARKTTLVFSDPAMRNSVGWTNGWLTAGAKWNGYTLASVAEYVEPVGPTPEQRDAIAARMRDVRFGNGETWVDGVMTVSGPDRVAALAKAA